MKLLSLNLWGGKDFGPLMEYLTQQISTIDIFCFQEVFDTKDHLNLSHDIRADLWQDLSNLFLDFHKFYYPAFEGIDDKGRAKYNLTSGLGMFVKRSIKIDNEGDYFVYRRRFAHLENDTKGAPVNLQFVNFRVNGKKILICNCHGIWYPGDKLDTKDRIKQLERILKFSDNHTGAKIICGDFNLMPQTKSMAILENKLRDLIKEFNIKRTRSKLSPFYNQPDEQKFADYTFVSKDVEVITFQVPQVTVSDHLPMILEFVP